ncbi:ligase-associated DNA damage response exonuclease [Thermoflexibacter ruber]|uniref:Putative mRNA 3-end processing factor n=1 Tax=Thermoflexibacter ruber TaxID=1003 RepID=A0A1I2I5N2_9BACT|nr:ligase-associated DNA damage response exonuclease [Thermoflexibacter ruber]SFF37602.1 putative mRNA 3-end processing factor [Thermoflexibacter ruber]
MLTFTDKGIYCLQGDFYIDPWKPVKRAVITHAHSDHARWGSQFYLAHEYSAPILRLRLGQDIQLQTIPYNKPLYSNGVKVSFHPAGHIIGSSQIRVEYQGEVWVVSGDYKLEDDGISNAFEPVRCHTFITESTFGLPIYHWDKQEIVFDQMNRWWQKNKENGKQSVLIAYSLGKAQRLIQHLDTSIGKVFGHGAVYQIQQTFVEAGFPIKSIEKWGENFTKPEAKGALIIAPQSAINTPWLRRFEPYSLGMCSGWVAIRGTIRRRNADVGFVLSDHADWKGLLSAIQATEASKVFVTHGFTATFARYLNEIGVQAAEVQTEFGKEEEEQISTNTEKLEEGNLQK